MKETNWENALEDLSHRLDLIQSRAREDSARFQEICKQAELTKVQILAHQLESRRKHLAHNRGVASVAENKKSRPITLGMTAGITILTRMITKDWRVAAATGPDLVLQGLGDTDWAVCLGKHLAVAPQDHITMGDIWVTWDSLQTALHELEERAKSGAPLGSLDNIISELKKNRKLLFVIRRPQMERPSSFSEPRL